MSAIDQIQALNAEKQVKAKYILWGGEPLFSPAFPAIAKRLHDAGCRISVVTNGILLKEQSDAINQYVDTLYVSIDGPKEIHECVRGQAGIYEKLRDGISAIDKDKVKTIGMFTICEDNYHVAAEFPYEAEKLGLSGVVFQNLIYCSSAIADKFKSWMHSNFNQNANAVHSWIVDGFGGWVDGLPEIIKTLKENIANRQYPLDVKLYPKCWMNENVGSWFSPECELQNSEYRCQLPWKHIHVRANGNIDFCVDHTDFVLGNLREQTLHQMLESEKANLFRTEIESGNNPLCRRCPWHYNRDLLSD